ncbi:hypothetical protein Glove_541g38 [Diversispora epigaea]|uniref:Uncharacterized protein n=1 Tax=Diversispora epigaea TaxID=1348612 RepID=A0A397GCV8_9GLOM|nr:hypothetical protein Glove_541g38 [Diversispora epigaea]
MFRAIYADEFVERELILFGYHPQNYSPKSEKLPYGKSDLSKKKRSRSISDSENFSDSSITSEVANQQKSINLKNLRNQNLINVTNNLKKKLLRAVV